MAETRKSKSPYQRYNKAPYRYSELYYQWRAAVLKGDTRLARELSAKHSQKFGPPWKRVEVARLAA